MRVYKDDVEEGIDKTNTLNDVGEGIFNIIDLGTSGWVTPQCFFLMLDWKMSNN